MTKYCRECGHPIADGEAFCKECGSEVQRYGVDKKSAPESTAAQNSAHAAAEKPQSKTQVTEPAETAILLTALSGDDGEKTDNTEILSPVKTLSGSAEKLFSRFKKPDKKALAGAIIMAVIWLLLWLFDRAGSGSGFFGFLSALTFAEGGMHGTFGQVLGGIFGKTLVMCGFVSLFSGGLPEAVKGIGRFFGKGFSTGAALAGFGFAILCYQLFAGYAGGYGTAVAVSGAFLSLKTLGGGTGFLGKITQSLTSHKDGDMRKADDTGLKSLLSGLSVGFIYSAALSALYVPWWIGAALLLIGIALSFVLNRKAVTA